MQHLVARAAAGLTLGLVSCTVTHGHGWIGWLALPILIFAWHVVDPRQPLTVPVAVALGRLCWILPLLPVTAPGDISALVAWMVAGPMLVYWLLSAWLYCTLALMGAGCGLALRRRRARLEALAGHGHPLTPITG